MEIPRHKILRHWIFESGFFKWQLENRQKHVDRAAIRHYVPRAFFFHLLLFHNKNLVRKKFHRAYLVTGSETSFSLFSKFLSNNLMGMFLFALQLSFKITHFQVSDNAKFCVYRSGTMTRFKKNSTTTLTTKFKNDVTML